MPSDVLSMLGPRAEIRRPTYTTEASGETSQVYATTAYRVPCAMRNASATERQAYGSRAQASVVVFTFPGGSQEAEPISIDAKDRIAIRIDGSTVRTFEVLAVERVYDQNIGAYFPVVASLRVYTEEIV